MKKINDIENLIVKYFNNELLPEEADNLLNVLDNDDEAKKVFFEYAQLHRTFSKLPNIQINKSKSLANIRCSIQQRDTHYNEKSLKKISLSAWLSAAAAVVLITLSIWFYWNSFSNQIIRTAKNEILTQQLSDGTEVTLNSNSTLIFPRKFLTKYRKVYLSGEAYFQVTKKSNNPFIVETKHIMVKVLGTSFNICDDSLSNEVIVVVDNGHISVSNQSKSQVVVLQKNETAIFNKTTNNLILQKNHNINYLSWRTGILIFQETPLTQVAKDLSKHYGIRIIVKNTELSNCKLDAKIKNYKLEEVFQMLETIFDIEVKQENETYIIAGKGC